MKVRWLAVLVLVSQMWLPAVAIEVESQNILITEVMVASSSSASAEFIEIYNSNDSEVDLADIKIQYKSATGLSWQTKVDFEDSEVALPRGFTLLATEEMGLDEISKEFNPGLAASAGHLRIVELKTEVLLDEMTGESTETETEFIHDQLGWGDNADDAEGDLPAPAPAADQSLKRLVDEDGEFMDTDVNLDDFQQSEEPNPQMSIEVSSGGTDESDDKDEPDDTEVDKEPDNEAIDYAKLIINELLPDPAPPKTDADDEFIELYNPNSFEVDLSGYILQTGSSLQYSETIDDVIVAPKSYVVFTSEDTGLVLSNSGSRVQLLAPDDSVAAELVSYGKVKQGETWSRFDDNFKWSNQSTPGAQNKKSIAEPTQTKKTTTAASTIKKNYPKIQLSELLPDPDSPQTDADDEFVEIYNPNSFPVNLSGFKIKSGSNLRTNHTIENLTVKAKSYVVFFSSNARITLSNNGGRVELQDPNGTVKSFTEYSKAETGASWALISGEWEWTSRPSPAAKNTLVGLASTTNSKQNSSNTGPTTSVASDALGSFTQPAVINARDADYRLIATATILALGYGLYEFRYDVRAKFHKFRQYYTNRRVDR